MTSDVLNQPWFWLVTNGLMMVVAVGDIYHCISLDDDHRHSFSTYLIVFFDLMVILLGVVVIAASLFLYLSN